MSLFDATNKAHPYQSGFTLVEVMVAMVIGMLGIIIMMQMYSVFEGQKRSTSGGNDAQNAGSVAMYEIQQNIQQAGYCFAGSAVAQAPTLSSNPLKPVMLDYAAIAGIGDANTNTVMITYGNDSCAPQSVSGVASAATLNIVAYAVRNESLVQCSYLVNDCANAANWVEIASNIVSLKAECNAGQGVRVALVARNSQLEKTAVTANAPAWQGGSAINLAATALNELTATDLATRDGKAAWQYYRYKTIETLAPIRNSIWTGASGC